MKPQEIVYTACTVLFGGAGVALSFTTYGDLRAEYHPGSAQMYEHILLQFILFTAPSLLVLMFGLVNALSGRLRRIPTRFQGVALCFTCVGIPLAVWTTFLYRARFSDQAAPPELGDEESYQRPREEDT